MYMYVPIVDTGRGGTVPNKIAILYKVPRGQYKIKKILPTEYLPT